MVCDEVLGNRQAEPGAAAAGHERIKNIIEQIGGDTWAVVFTLDAQHELVPLLAKIDGCAGRACGS